MTLGSFSRGLRGFRLPIELLVFADPHLVIVGHRAVPTCALCSGLCNASVLQSVGRSGGDTVVFFDALVLGQSDGRKEVRRLSGRRNMTLTLEA